MAPSKESSKTNGAAPRTATTPALDLPVGAVLAVTDRVGELVEPFSGRKGAEKQLKAYRTSLRRQVKRAERRGATARRQATASIKRNRDDLEQRVRDLLPV